MYILKEVRAFEKARNVCRLCLLDSFGLKRESVYKLMCCYLSLFSLYGCALRCVCVDVLSCCCCCFLLFVFYTYAFYYAFTKRNEHMSPLFYSLHKATVETRYEKKKTRKKTNKTLETTRNTRQRRWYDATAESNI